MKTEAAILVETGRPLVLVELGIPPLGPGQVLVEIAYSGACGTQVMEWRGEKGPDKWLPHCLGHEGTGTILDIGEGVTKVRPGDSVVLSWLRGSGEDASGCQYDWDGKPVNAGGVTTFQRHSVVSENRVSKMPEGLASDLGVLLGCASPTGMGSIINVLKMQPGDSIAIFGTGGIGLNACIAASLLGGDPIIGIDPNPTRRELATTYGCTHVVDPAGVDPVGAVLQIAPQGVDLAVEASGVPTVINQAVDAVRAQGGQTVVIGNAPAGSELTIDSAIFNQGKSILGTWGGDTQRDRDFPEFAKMLGSGRFPAGKLLSAPYCLEDATQALEDLAAGLIGRPLIDMSMS